MKRFISKKTVAIGLAAGLILGAGGAAFAYWTTAGSGTGSATTGVEVSNLQITNTTSIGDMAPGLAAEPITGTIQNLNAAGGQNQQVNDVTVSIASVTQTTAGALAGTCDATDYDLSNAAMVVNTDLTPGQTVSFSGASIGFHDKGNTVDQDGCQGATVNLSYASN